MVSGIRALKAYAWEKAFASHVARTRKMQSTFLMKLNFATALMFLINVSSVGPLNSLFLLYMMHTNGYDGRPSDILFVYLFIQNAIQI